MSLVCSQACCKIERNAKGKCSAIKIVSDFTFFTTVNKFPKNHRTILKRGAYSGETVIKCTIPAVHGLKPPPLDVSGRILACKCRRPEETGSDSCVSVTARIDSKSLKAANKQLAKWFVQHAGEPEMEALALSCEQKPTNIDADDWKFSNYCPSTDTGKSQPVSIASVVSSLSNNIFRDERQKALPLSQMHGAILIAGRTKSAKSLITRGLIHSLFSSPEFYNQIDRRPHLVTCEDPVETYFFPKSRHELGARMLDITARDKTSGDYADLHQAYLDALRQTPACFYVGEVRSEKELIKTIDFAGTGHLVIATLHAGSVPDVFSKVFSAKKAQTPANRGLIGQSLLSVVHLKMVPATIDNDSYEVVVPSMWRRTQQATAALVSAGIGALTPHMAEDSEDSKQASCLGRQYFAKQLLDEPALQTKYQELSRALDLAGE